MEKWDVRVGNQKETLENQSVYPECRNTSMLHLYHHLNNNQEKHKVFTVLPASPPPPKQNTKFEVSIFSKTTCFYEQNCSSREWWDYYTIIIINWMSKVSFGVKTFSPVQGIMAYLPCSCMSEFFLTEHQYLPVIVNVNSLIRKIDKMSSCSLI